MIGFYYKEIQLGTLSFDNETQEFIYNSIIENEIRAKKKYHMIKYYSLENSKDKRGKNIFEEFLEFVQSLSRHDVIEMAKIKKDEPLYNKLEKLASLSLNEDDFYIKKC